MNVKTHKKRNLVQIWSFCLSIAALMVIVLKTNNELTWFSVAHRKPKHFVNFALKKKIGSTWIKIKKVSPCKAGFKSPVLWVLIQATLEIRSRWGQYLHNLKSLHKKALVSSKKLCKMEKTSSQYSNFLNVDLERPWSQKTRSCFFILCST